MSVGRFIKRFLPRGLFGRSLIIGVAPVAVLLGILTYVFFERELDITTRSLARDVAADISLLVALEDSTPALERDALRALTARQLRYRISFHDGVKVQVPQALLILHVSVDLLESVANLVQTCGIKKVERLPLQIVKLLPLLVNSLEQFHLKLPVMKQLQSQTWTL